MLNYAHRAICGTLTWSRSSHRVNCDPRKENVDPEWVIRIIFLAVVLSILPAYILLALWVRMVHKIDALIKEIEADTTKLAVGLAQWGHAAWWRRR